MTSLELAKKSAKILDDKKGIDIKVVYIKDISILSDYLVIVTGTSSTHVKSLAEETEAKLKDFGVAPYHIEGHRSNSWILLDYGSVIIHVFSEETREFYNLEKLWKDGQEIEIDL